jgi:hypothetical protein
MVQEKRKPGKATLPETQNTILPQIPAYGGTGALEKA